MRSRPWIIWIKFLITGVSVDRQAQRAEKISYLKKLFKQTRITKNPDFNNNYFKYPVYRQLETFLLKFNYHKELVKKFPKIQVIATTAPAPAQTKFILPQSTEVQSLSDNLYRKNICRPQLNRFCAHLAEVGRSY